jgi:hypothetical protein
MIANNARSLLRKEFICLLFLIVVLQVTLIRVEGYSGSQIVIPLLTKPVTIDGQFSADEWSDALMTPLINCACSNVTASGYLYAKHDPSNFYFLIDFTSSTVLDANNDGMSVMLDLLHNDGTVPQSDDREFIAFPIPPGSAMRVGTGVQGNGWSLSPLPQGVKMAYSMASSSSQAQPHEIAEFLLPFSTFSGMQGTIGFTVTAQHGAPASSQFSLALWPANFARQNLATWGELTIFPTPIPEFPYVWLIIDVTLMASLTLTWSRRKSSERVL